MKLILLFLIGIASVFAQSSEELENNSELSSDLNDADCKQAGLSCFDSNHLIFCQNGGTGFKELSKVSCSDKYGKSFCCSNNACTKDGCSSSGENPDDGHNFQCTEEGTFPSPFNCSIYYICDKNLQKTMGTCLCASFNATTGKCHNVQATQNGGCDNQANCDLPSINCNDTLVFKAFPDSKQYYATCVSSDGEFIVEKCADGFLFDESTNLCQLDCKGDGNFEDPTDCHSYYQCSGEGSIGKKESCGKGMAFDPNTDGCLPENLVSACKNQGESTTTSASTSAGTAGHSDATTEQPTVPSTQPTTTQPPKFHCQCRGIFSDPRDCHSYYICLDRINYVHGSCQIGQYYNHYYQRCLDGSC